MLSQDPKHLRATVARYYAPGAVLYHYLTRAATALDMYRVYRTYTSSFVSRPVVRDIIIDTRLRNPFRTAQHRHQFAAVGGVLTGPGRRGLAQAEAEKCATGATSGPGGTGIGKAAPATAASEAPPPEGCTAAAVWLDQHVTPKLGPFKVPFIPETIVPTIVLLKFRPCPGTGRPLVYEQYDHISTYGFVWSFGPPARWLFQQVLTPAVMYGMGTYAYMLDFMEETWRFVEQQVFNRPPGGEASASAVGASLPKGAGGGTGPTCGEPRGFKGSGAAGAVRGPGSELPGEVNHAATGYGLLGEQLDGGDLATPQATIAATRGSGASAANAAATGAGSTANQKPLPFVPLR